MSSKRKVNNLLGLAVLSYLSQRPMHPYELGKQLREHGDDRSIKFRHGSLYMVVQQLEKAGFVAKEGTSREGQRPERSVYSLTDEGRREMRDWLREIIAEPHHEYPEFVAGLSLIAALPPAEVRDLLERRRARLDEESREIRELVDSTVAGGVHPLFLVEEDYRLALLDAEQAFVTGFIEKIDNGWGPLWEQFHGDPAEEE